MVRHLSDVLPGKHPVSTAAPAMPMQQYAGFVVANYRVLGNPSVHMGFVNFRWASSLDATVQSSYYVNAEIRVIATNGTWCQVIDVGNNVCGFMMSAYMKRRMY